MICSCGCEFAPTVETFYAAQVIPDIQYTILHACPRCRSTRSLLLWESFELALHFGEAEPEEEEEDLPLAAE